MSEEQQRSILRRKRGVRASRLKLEKAMSKAGIKTQIELAEKLADAEGLKLIPKDFVSRIFREKRVEIRSIQRIATVLGVEPHTLYKNEVEEEETAVISPAEAPITQDPNKPSVTIESPKKSRKNITYTLILGLLVMGIFSYFHFAQEATSQSEAIPSSSTKQPPLRSYSLLLRYNQALKPLAKHLEQSLSKKYRLSTPDNAVTELEFSSPADQLARKYQADLVLLLNSKEFDDFLFVEAQLFNQGVLFDIWNTAIRKSLAEYNPQALWQALLKNVHQIATNNTIPDSPAPASAQKYYLEGRKLLDKGGDDLNIKSAQSRFTNAIKAQPNHALAHAALCQALVSESWMGDEKQLLEDAQQACDTAQQLAPKHHYVIASVAYLYFRFGRAQEAIDLVKDFLTNHSATSDTLLSLANAQYELYKKHPDRTALLNQSRDNLHTATSISPKMWHAFLTLGHIELTVGDLPSAIAAMAQANNISPNEVLLGNLGTLNFCLSNLEIGKEYFLDLLKHYPEAHIGPEMLSMIAHFQADYATAIRLRLQGIKKAGEANNYQIWGPLAESYFMQGNRQQANRYYLKTLELLEKSKLLGNYSSTEEVMAFYYQVRLAQNNPEEYKLPTEAPATLTKLSKNANGLESSALMRLTLLHKFFGNTEHYQSLFDTLTQRCPVYATLPEIRQP